MENPRVGPFELDSPIAEGGMGQVWLGRHVDSGHPVAIKVLTGRMTQRPQFRTTFRNEARSMSTLKHPHIVSIYDFGEMKQSDTASESFGHTSPYIVMEYLPHTLSTRNPVTGWRSFKRLVLELLDALCHAHARGVIHRDLKPGNILIDENGLSHVSDFGIAFGTNDAGIEVENMRAAGTPEYMAPEQCHGMWRDFGPWTDLYAIGCIAFELCSGEAPFQGPNQMSIMLTKLKGQIPELLPRFAVPPEFGAWLNCLLSRDPENRYQCAADAAWVLRGLSSDFDGALEELDSLDDVDVSLDPDTVISPRTGGSVEHSINRLHKGKQTLNMLPSYEGMTNAAPQGPHPPFPVDWRKSDRRQHTRPLSRTGLELYAMRQPTILGRQRLRDQLWQVLRDVHASQRPQTVLLSGPTGIGKTTLAKWLCETAHEFGVATPMYGFHGEQEMPAHGLHAMLMRHLRCTGLTKREIRTRLAGLMRYLPNAEEETEALTELIAPPDLKANESSDNSTIRFFAPVERHSVLARQLERMSRERPLIMWLDDIQFGFEALAFIEWYMTNQRASIVFIMTATSEDLASRGIETSIIETLQKNNQVTILDLPPLPHSEHRQLIDSSLPLDKDLVDRILARTSGNPRFALDLIHSLVDQNGLVLGQKGYVLANKQVIEMPSSLAEIWDARLATFLATRSEHDAECLELAACLGLQVNLVEWTALCRVADVNVTPGLKLEVVEQRFVTEFREESGQTNWHFAHGMLREALLRHARHMGRFEQHHTHAVNMLRVADAPPSRIGKHLLAATQWNAALGPLERAVREGMVAGDHRAAQSALIDWTDALRLLNFPDNRRDWLKIALADAHIRHIQGDLSEALEITLRTIAKARQRPYRRILCEALLLNGSIFIKLAQFENALGALSHLDSIPRRHLTMLDEAYYASTKAQALERLGRFDEANTNYAHAETFFMQEDDIIAASMARLGRARSQRAMGSMETAVNLAESAGVTLGCAGSKVGVSDALFQLGEVARMVDDLDRAEHHYRKAQRGYRRVGSNKRLDAEMMLAMVLVERHAFLEARLLLEQLLSIVRHRENRAMTATLHLLLANCCAQDESWIEWTEHVKSAEQILVETPMIDFDIATYAERAALGAYQANQLNAAKIPQAIADLQFATLKRQPHSS